MNTDGERENWGQRAISKTPLQALSYEGVNEFGKAAIFVLAVKQRREWPFLQFVHTLYARARRIRVPETPGS
jgi:hypothetical protein